MSQLKLGILDFGTITPDKTSYQVLNETLTLALKADKLCFSRYWLTEHHSETAAWASPEIMASQVAKVTKKIRVGSAGVLLSFYSPFKVAENFRLLEALFPERIDLGLGRGTVDDNKFDALNDYKTGKLDPEKIYYDKVKSLLNHLKNDFPNDHPFRSIKANPIDTGMPEIWLCGSGNYSVKLASDLGISFSYSLFLKRKEIIKETIDRYYENFIPCIELKAPKANIAVAGICAENEKTVKKIKEKIFNKFLRINFAGTPEQCKENLLQLQSEFKVDEIIFIDLSNSIEAKIRSIELLSNVIKLKESII